MVTIATGIATPAADRLSGLPRAHAVDRWIYVFTAAVMVAIVLVGFIPDSVDKLADVASGRRAPFSPLLHAHAVLMGSFLAALLAQTWLAATGRIGWHVQLGVLTAGLVPALVIVGFLLAPAIYQENWHAAALAAPDAQGELQAALASRENILLKQIRMGVIFPVLIAIAVAARRAAPGLHKRMMILATASVLSPALARMPWLPALLPSPLSNDVYMLLAILPMLAWDVARNGHLHRAYWLWAAINLPFVVAIQLLWDTPWWHMAARQLLLA